MPLRIAVIAAAGVALVLLLRGGMEAERAPETTGLRAAAAATAGAAAWRGGTPTFAEDVAPILFRHCAACHRPEGPGPFSVLSYDEARRMAPAIANAVRERRMPPWMPAPGRGQFADERRLSDAEIATLETWAAAGAPEGDPRALPAAPELFDGWHLGEPDLVVELPVPYTVAAGHHDMFRHFVIPLPFRGTRWVNAVEVRVTDPSVVHHLHVLVDATPTARRLEVEDPEPGYDASRSMGTEGMPPGFFLGWTPGRIPTPDRAGLAWPLNGGDDLVVQFHLRPIHRPATLSAKIGFHFADGPPERVPTIVKLTTETIDIPPGEARHVETDTYELPVDVDVLGVYPHAHFLAREFQVLATVPGEVDDRWLVHIPRWDFNWQDAYAYREPVRLPAGTVLTMHIVYDNSEANPANPNRPPERIVYGPRSTDEMGDVYLRVLPANPEDLEALERDLTLKWVRDRIGALNHRLAADPADVGALEGLGQVYLSVRAFDRAAAYYGRALALAPDDPNLLYNHGVALQGAGVAAEALERFRRVTELVPGHAGAHHSLANALVQLQRRDDAIRHYRRALELDPGRADAHGQLGVLLLERGEVPNGLAHLLRAAEGYFADGDAGAAADLAEDVAEVARAAGQADLAEAAERLIARIRG